MTAHKQHYPSASNWEGNPVGCPALPCPAARRVTVVCLLPLDGRVVVFTSSSVFTSSLYQTSDENTDICPHGSRKTARSIESSVLPRGGNECMVDESCVPITHRQSGKRKQLLVPVPGGSRRRQFVGAPIPIMSLHLHDVPRGQARVMAPRGTGLLLRLTRRARAAPGSSRVGSAARVRARSRTAPHGWPTHLLPPSAR